jgi:hypothetical protein
MHMDFVGVGATRKADDAEFLVAPLPPHLNAAALVDPMNEGFGRRRADVSAEYCRGLVDAPVIARPSVASRRDLFLDRFRDFQRAADGAGREDLEGDFLARQRLRFRRETLGERVEVNAARP